uniref:Uncharacterized protein n=1 Tax=Anser brachyrhynchus TaxID=132585 RepID=A0A8B9I7K3_9AVES
TAILLGKKKKKSDLKGCREKCVNVRIKMHNRQSRIQDFVMKLIKRQHNVSQRERIKNWLFSYNTSHAVMHPRECSACPP